MNSSFDADYRLRGRRWGGYSDIPPIPDGALVLEAGCGNGKTLHRLMSVTGRAVGVDISPEAVRLAGSSSAVAGDIRSLPFADGIFDAVVCFHVLGHLTECDRVAAANELVRVTRPGGSVWVSVFSRHDFRYGVGVLVEPHSFLKGDGIMTHYFSEDEVYSLFSGWCVEIGESLWMMRVRGVDYPRAVLHARLVKQANTNIREAAGGFLEISGGSG